MEAKLAERDVSLWCFDRLLPLLAGLADSGTQRDRAGNRRLFFDGYVKLVFLYLMNPMIDSLRTLQQASMLNTVSKKLGIARFSLGSFSEASAVFEPELLKSVIQELGVQAVKLPVNPELKQLKHLLTIVDGTLLATLPKLTTTLCYSRRNGRPHHAWRLHMHLPLGDLVPELIIRTSGSNRRECTEREQLKGYLQPGRCYVLDRGFHEATLFNTINQADSSYVCRLRNNVNPDVLEELPVTDSAAAAGVVSDRIVQLSTYDKCVGPTDHPVRLITIYAQPHPKRSPDAPSTVITLTTNLLDVPAELIGTIYQYRWTIELFFRLIKQLLGCRHLLSHRGAGVDIQIYCAMIACLLIYLHTGKRPNKYMLFMTGMYLSGTASLEEMLAFVNRVDNTGIKKRAKDELWKKLGVN